MSADNGNSSESVPKNPYIPPELVEGQTKHGAPRKSYTKRPPEFWEMIAEEYLRGGVSQGFLAEKYGTSAPLVRYYLDGIFKSGLLERRKAYLAKAKEVGDAMAIDDKTKAQAWVEEEVERCYQFREKIEECLVGTDNPKEVAYLSSAEERIDKVARRSMGMEEKIGVNGALNVTGLVEVAVRVYAQQELSGATPVIDADFELEDDTQQNAP